MSRIQQPLPNYGTVVRWTVQDVINWLSSNKFDACSRCFRDSGVDGNKFVNITKSDLMGIQCPKKFIDAILQQVTNVSGRPGRGMARGGANHANHQVPVIHQNHLSTAEDDDGGWDSDEFSDSGNESDPAPVAPPRPNRQKPAAKAGPPKRDLPPTPVQEEIYDEANNDDEPVFPTPAPPRHVPTRTRPAMPVPPLPNGADGSDEEYEEPDLKPMVQNFHGGRLPPLPTQVPSKPPQNKPSPSNNTKHQSGAVAIGRRKPPPLPAPEEDEYLDPDDPSIQQPELRKPPPPPISGIPKGRSSDFGEDYEEPMMEPQPPPVRRPAAPQPQVEEVYEDPDPETQGQETYEECEAIPEIRAPAPRKAPGKPAAKPPPPEEMYEVPDTDDQGVEDYLDMNEELELPVRPAMPKPVEIKALKPQKSPRGGRRAVPEPTSPAVPLPKRGHQPKLPVPEPPEQEMYEVPDQVEEPAKDSRMKKHFVAVLPSLPVNRPVPSNVPVRATRMGGKALPPPPTIEPVKEVVMTPPPKKLPVASQARSEEVKKPVADDLESRMLTHRWYHGDITRDEASKQLAIHRTDGMYLIRKSTKKPDQPYTLQIFYNGKDYNLPVKKTGDTYTVGNNQAFPSLLEMINKFKTSTLVLNQTTNTKLLCSLPKT